MVVVTILWGLDVIFRPRRGVTDHWRKKSLIFIEHQFIKRMPTQGRCWCQHHETSNNPLASSQSYTACPYLCPSAELRGITRAVQFCIRRSCQKEQDNKNISRDKPASGDNKYLNSTLERPATAVMTEKPFATRTGLPSDQHMRNCWKSLPTKSQKEQDAQEKREQGTDSQQKVPGLPRSSNTP